MRELLAVYVLFFYGVVAIGTIGLMLYNYPWLAPVAACFASPFLVWWAIDVLEETK